MSGHVTLTYRDLDKAYKFMNEAGDDGEVIAVDHPDFYCTRVHGVYRAPLPPLVERGQLDDEDEAEQGQEVLEECLEDVAALFDDREIDDEYASMAQAYGIDDDRAEQEYYDCWGKDVSDAAAAFEVNRPVPPTKTVHVLTARKVESRSAAPKRIAPADEEEGVPLILSSRRAVLTGPKQVLKETGPDRHCWKDNTRNAAQYLRHA